MWEEKLKAYLKKYWANGIFWFIGLIIGTLLTTLVSQWNPVATAISVVGVVIIVILLAIFLRLRQLIDNRIEAVSNILKKVYGNLFDENLYFQRASHFSREKQELAKVLVKEVLPRIAKDAKDLRPGLKHFNIILDSGTTLTPIFPIISKDGVDLPDDVELNVYSNSLSGFGELHMIDRGLQVLSEDSFNLLGGKPLFKYQAVTGPAAEDALAEGKLPTDEAQRSIRVGVLTANWIAAGVDFRKIHLSASGTGHADFKSKVIDTSDYLVVVAPFGKLLDKGSVDDLNEFLRRQGAEAYEECEIVSGKRDTTWLLTTLRPDESLSPLLVRSQLFRKIKDGEQADIVTTNYQIAEESPTYDIPGTKEEVLAVELPHLYIRRNAREAYGPSIKL